MTVPIYQHSHLKLIVIFILFISILFFFTILPFFQPLKKALQEPNIPTSMLDNGSLGALLKHQNLVEKVKNFGDRFPRGFSNKQYNWGGVDEEDQLVTFQKKRKPSQLLYRPAKKRASENTSSHLFLKTVKQKHGWPIIAITIPDRSLNDSGIGIVANRSKKGRDWERKATVDFYDNGKNFLSTNAGLRIHGGKPRKELSAQNFRLYFRKEYGLEKIPAGVLFEKSGDLYSIVLQLINWPKTEPMNNPIAYDLAREIGAPSPHTKLFEIYLNQNSLGMAYVTEHLSERQMRQYMSDPNNFVLYKYNDRNSPKAERLLNEKMHRHLKEINRSTYQDILDTIDKDNFSRHLFPWAFNGLTDFCQGVAVYDTGAPATKLKWIEWDLGHSFSDIYNQTKRDNQEVWKQTAFSRIYNDQTNCDRVLLFTDLINNVPQYKEYIVTLYSEILNHRLTSEFFHDRVSYYEQMLSEFGNYSSYIIMLRDFFENRPDFLRNDMARQLQLEGPYYLTVNNSNHDKFYIDNNLYNRPYSGKYFGGQEVTVSFADDPDSRIFSHWLINGKTSKSPSVTLRISNETDIKLYTRLDKTN